MAKKIDEAEIKKECPSCGLGVALDSTICEFCGWDFEEEDEWILQIEKLERDLLLEKQKYEPGSVNEKIESTLHTPAEEMKAIRSSRPATEERPKTAAVSEGPHPQPKRVSQPEAPARPARTASAPAPKSQAPAAKVRRVRTVKTSPATESEGGLVTRVTPAVQREPEGAQPAPTRTVSRKVRLVRKVK
jgi:hypothetical protein